MLERYATGSFCMLVTTRGPNMIHFNTGGFRFREARRGVESLESTVVAVADLADGGDGDLVVCNVQRGFRKCLANPWALAVLDQPNRIYPLDGSGAFLPKCPVSAA